jgi:hypothetical protein
MGMAIMRATTSVGPPAAKGTTKAMGLSGNAAVWALATPLKVPHATAQANSKDFIFCFIVVSVLKK